MTLFLEIMFSFVLIAGLCYFVFDVKFIKVIALISIPIMLIATGFFMGIGIHLTNLAFGW
jgi:hypothetical protein